MPDRLADLDVLPPAGFGTADDLFLIVSVNPLDVLRGVPGAFPPRELTPLAGGPALDVHVALVAGGERQAGTVDVERPVGLGHRAATAAERRGTLAHLRQPRLLEDVVTGVNRLEPLPADTRVVLADAAEDTLEEFLDLRVGRLPRLIDSCAHEEGGRCDLPPSPGVASVVRVMEQRVVLAIAEREMGDGRPIRDRVVVLAQRRRGDTDPPAEPLDVLVEDLPLGHLRRRLRACSLACGHRSLR